MNKNATSNSNIGLSKQSANEYQLNNSLQKADVSKKRMSRGIWKGLKRNIWRKKKAEQNSADLECSKNLAFKNLINYTGPKGDSTNEGLFLYMKESTKANTGQLSSSIVTQKVEKLAPYGNVHENIENLSNFGNKDLNPKPKSNKDSLRVPSIHKIKDFHQCGDPNRFKNVYKNKNNLSLSRQKSENRKSCNKNHQRKNKKTDSKTKTKTNQTTHDSSSEISEFINNIINESKEEHYQKSNEASELIKFREFVQQRAEKCSSHKKLLENYIGHKAKNIFENMNVTQRALAETLGAKNMRGIVKPPITVCRLQWLASLLYTCLEDIQLVMSCIWESCHCDMMTAGCVVYFWKMDGKYVSLSSRNYIERCFLWIDEHISDTNIFECEGMFFSISRTCARLIFRIYAHVYRHHIHHLETYNAVAHLNLCFKHFLFLADEYQLLQANDLQPLENLCGAYLSRVSSEDNVSSKLGLNENLCNLKILKSELERQFNEEKGILNPVCVEDTIILHKNETKIEKLDTAAKALLSCLTTK